MIQATSDIAYALILQMEANVALKHWLTLSGLRAIELHKRRCDNLLSYKNNFYEYRLLECCADVSEELCASIIRATRI
jgi:hypothetical protein